ncbi:hypothetical protein FOL46_006329 [Perkinsus olseni]|uniref:Uncharacterized protein n=1 Tax=Perkinsus olseni TaxID=32597 RepID=A0A7J6LLI4_PEROL|nr:hypothetical protein FOL46_006329 [Perkinsus olseni]
MRPFTTYNLTVALLAISWPYEDGVAQAARPGPPGDGSPPSPVAGPSTSSQQPRKRTNLLKQAVLNNLMMFERSYLSSTRGGSPWPAGLDAARPFKSLCYEGDSFEGLRGGAPKEYSSGQFRRRGPQRKRGRSDGDPPSPKRSRAPIREAMEGVLEDSGSRCFTSSEDEYVIIETDRQDFHSKDVTFSIACATAEEARGLARCSPELIERAVAMVAKCNGVEPPGTWTTETREKFLAPPDVEIVSEPGQNLPPSEVDKPISILRKKDGDVKKKKGGISFNETVRVRPIERLVSSDDDEEEEEEEEEGEEEETKEEEEEEEYDNYYGEDKYEPLQDEESDTSEGESSESSDTNEEEQKDKEKESVKPKEPETPPPPPPSLPPSKKPEAVKITESPLSRSNSLPRNRARFEANKSNNKGSEPRQVGTAPSRSEAPTPESNKKTAPVKTQPLWNGSTKVESPFFHYDSLLRTRSKAAATKALKGNKPGGTATTTSGSETPQKPNTQPVSTKTSETAESPFSRANSLPRNRIKMASAKSHTSGDGSKKGIATKKGVVKPELQQVKHNLGELKKTLEKGDQEKPGEQSKATSTTGGAPSRSPFTRGVNPQLGTEWTDENGHKQRSFRSYLHKPRVPPQQTKEPKEIPVDRSSLRLKSLSKFHAEVDKENQASGLQAGKLPLTKPRSFSVSALDTKTPQSSTEKKPQETKVTQSSTEKKVPQTKAAQGSAEKEGSKTDVPKSSTREETPQQAGEEADPNDSFSRSSLRGSFRRRGRAGLQDLAKDRDEWTAL